MQEDLEEYQAFAIHLTAEHRRIAECLRHVEKELQFVGADAPGTLAGVVQSLTQLRTELSKHFKEEEAGGCLEEAVIHHLASAAEASRVIHEHPQLLAGLDTVIEKFTSAGATDRLLGEIRREFEQFAKQLRAHEAAETRIFQECFGTEAL